MRQPYRGAIPCRAAFVAGLSVVLAISVLSAMAQDLILYVDNETKQVYTEPGPNRSRLGTFRQVQEAAPSPSPQAVVVPSPGKSVESADTRLDTLETRVEEVANAEKELEKKVGLIQDNTAPAVAEVLKGKWYERVSLRGYTQFRYSLLLNQTDSNLWFHPADRSVSRDEGFLIRRGRLILSGDVSDHFFLYIQPDLNASPSDGDFAVQLRDLYADISFDKKKEFRVRLGQSKVPFGFVNLQSSQNRAPLERPDALNSAVEGERDIGAFFYWAPQLARERFRALVRDGLKGSGDYGVFGLGVYNGQGLNRLDSNSDVHAIARLSYPFQFASGQYFEPGIQGYTGTFMPRTAAIQKDGTSFTPTFQKSGVRDKRLGLTAVLYPQPFGIEAEWNFGRGPTLVDGDRRIDDRWLHGGYVMGTYRTSNSWGMWVPFIRWQYFDGGRKFARNAPKEIVNEYDFGFEYSPWQEVEITTMYSFTPTRTATNAYPYDDLEDGHRIAWQVQWNY